MKDLLILIALLSLLAGCVPQNENQPLTGSDWGDLRNGSAEDVVSSTVLHWTPESGQRSAQHFYSYDQRKAQKASASAVLTPLSGRWSK